MLRIDNIELLSDDLEEIALKVKNRYICCQVCDEGYDYSIFSDDFVLLDGGIYDNPENSFKQVLLEILVDIMFDEFLGKGVTAESELKQVDYDMVMEKGMNTERKTLQKRFLTDYKRRVEASFHPICGMGTEQVMTLAKDFLQEKIESYDLDAKITEIFITGSRSNGTEKENSDIDFVVEYEGMVREDFLFNKAHEDDFYIGNVLADINPINIEETGSTESYLRAQENYFRNKCVEKETTPN